MGGTSVETLKAHYLSSIDVFRDLPRPEVERLILQHPKVGLRFLEQLSARLLETEAVVQDFAFKGVPARLAGALLRLANATADGTIHVSHQELAET